MGRSVCGLVTLLGLVLALGAAHAGAATIDPVFCPAGEITLRSDRLVARAKATGKLRSPANEFVVPAGAGIDPGNEAVTYYVEADHVPVFKGELAAGELAANADGTSFLFKQRVSGGPVGMGSSIRLRQQGNLFKLKVRMLGADLSALASASPVHIKQVLKIGEDCFSSILACTAKGAKIKCRPERSAQLRGRVEAQDGTPLAGAMLTAYDDSRLESITVFAQEDGRYEFPPLRPGNYRLRARRIGSEDGWGDPVTLIKRRKKRHDFTLAPAADTNAQLPASLWFPLLLDKWPSQTSRGDFTLSCGNCHQIGDWRFRRSETTAEWNAVIGRMLPRLPPFFQETRDNIHDALIDTYGEGAPPTPLLELPPPPSGEVLGAVIYEYGLGDESSRPSCHDLELGLDNIVYSDDMAWIDPRTGERGRFPLEGGAHSVERDSDGNMWITQASRDTLAFMNVTTGEFRYFPLPLIGEEQGSWPHTLRFDGQGRIWFSTTRSTHLTLFDPATEQFTYYPLPGSDPAEVGLSIPTTYGCDTAPDGTVWYSQLHGQRIGRFTPGLDTIKDWRPPFYGPRRLHVDAEGIVWVPGYGSGVLGRFDPAIERWKVYPLPTGRPGPEGFGYSETPYALNANRNNAEVWVTGTNSDTLIRFEPASQQFTAFPLPSPVSYTREVEFDSDNNVWTCTSSASPEAGVPGRGKFVKIELPPITALCGDGRVGGREECDDGNDDDCDACSNRCTRVKGCGDGTQCGAEDCDDGNDDDCDGCSSLCELEPGLLCGDFILRGDCGEECDPPEAGVCTESCTIAPVCGNGVIEDDQECDDGNDDDCDACSNRCTLVTGCGDGTLCGGETCDDGNANACDGCLPTCELEAAGYVCGDGILRIDCNEECEPPSDVSPVCSYDCRNGPAAPLGTRHLSFGGPTFSSALGTSVALGTLEGEFDLVGGAPGADGITTLSVTQPFIYRAAILGGAFGYMCFNISSCSGSVDCNGGTAVGVEVIRDSEGPGEQGNPPVTTTGLGPDAGPGAVELSCEQAFFQIPGGQGDDCTIQTYPPETTVVYTTGQTEGRWLNANARIGTGELSFSGENFVCEGWTIEDGPGALAGSFLIENDPQAGDTANISVIDD